MENEKFPKRTKKIFNNSTNFFERRVQIPFQISNQSIKLISQRQPQHQYQIENPLKRKKGAIIFSFGKLVTYMNDGTSLKSVRQIRRTDYPEYN